MEKCENQYKNRRNFGENNYKIFIEIKFALNPEFKTIFDRSFNVDEILKEITLRRPEIKIIPHDTLIFFDEMQDCVSTATSLKSFREDGRYDVICSGLLIGINYKQIESNSVGNKEDYILHSMDFEEFLWAKGYKEEVIDDMLNSMIELEPLSNTMYDVMLENFKEYMITGGMPAIVSNFIESKNYKDIKYGIKLCNKNIGFNGKFYTFPYFTAFLLKRYLKK